MTRVQILPSSGIPLAPTPLRDAMVVASGRVAQHGLGN